MSWEPYELCTSSRLVSSALSNDNCHTVFDMVAVDNELRVLSSINNNRLLIGSVHVWVRLKLLTLVNKLLPGTHSIYGR